MQQDEIKQYLDANLLVTHCGLFLLSHIAHVISEIKILDLPEPLYESFS